MLKVILIIFTLLFANNSNADEKLSGEDFGYKYCNYHKFTFIFLKVYDTYLCFDEKQYLAPSEIYKTNFSLIIKYNRNFDRDELTKSSIEEMNRYYEISQSSQNIYYDLLFMVLPDVKEGDIIQAKYNKDMYIDFYHNSALTGEIKDPKLAKMFLDIWLYKDNKYQNMTKDLFKKL